MTTIPFLPNATTDPPFSAIVILDGSAYTMDIRWSIYRSDWYYSLTDQGGNLIVNAPFIGSPPTSDIYLAPGFFQTSTLLYRVSTGNIEQNP